VIGQVAVRFAKLTILHTHAVKGLLGFDASPVSHEGLARGVVTMAKSAIRIACSLAFTVRGISIRSNGVSLA